ncbi:response regulator [Jhaorihella thermophila]|uniref:Response regulator receiver domain-containing protein n=1 Tax=Jhaorihella thermophila TaxID=488547 RepID=A0A1H5W234_9RHOB|nr:response regulator [Jhaorihella thermophila]SEF92867.1 Response regulator receiver domain-containing protein [Jhaorihella thermophila]
MRILAVDDDPIILEILKEVLSTDAHRQVSVAESAEEALSMLAGADEQFDCFLLDIQMPGMDGVELCGRIRAMPQYARSPILMLTAMSEKSYIDRSFAAGASDYITKPFDMVEFEARIRTAEQIVEERRRAAESNLALMSLKKQDGTEQQRPPLSEPVTVADVDGMIEPLAFENYLLQLGRVQQFMSAVIAVKVANIAGIYQGCSGRSFRFFLEDMSDALADSLRRWPFLMCCFGNGIFLISVDRRVAEAVQEELRTSLPAALSEISPMFDDGTPIPIDIAVGSPSYPGLFKGRSVAAMIQVAIDDAELKAMHRPRLATKKPLGGAVRAQTQEERPDATAIAW